jgi:hypothetical protein
MLSRLQARLLSSAFDLDSGNAPKKIVIPTLSHTAPGRQRTTRKSCVPGAGRRDSPRSANLTDCQKIVAELFDTKIRSLGFSAVFAAQSKGLGLLDFIHVDFLRMSRPSSGHRCVE